MDRKQPMHRSQQRHRSVQWCHSPRNLKQHNSGRERRNNRNTLENRKWHSSDIWWWRIRKPHAHRTRDNQQHKPCNWNEHSTTRHSRIRWQRAWHSQCSPTQVNLRPHPTRRKTQVSMRKFETQTTKSSNIEKKKTTQRLMPKSSSQKWIYKEGLKKFGKRDWFYAERIATATNSISNTTNNERRHASEEESKCLGTLCFSKKKW